MNQQATASFTLPPEARKSSGEPRRTGFELEFSGIDLNETVKAICPAFDATVRSETEAEVELEINGLGTFNIEIDWAYLKTKAAVQDNRDRHWIELMSRAAALFVPVEVVCPPIEISRLAELNPLVESLRLAGAVGTEESFISAYGVHINTEIPDLEAATLNRYIRAYALLQWWLVTEFKVNPARRISPYIDLYPTAYIEKVLSRPDANMDQIFEDYLEHNPTRNRALDLLPLLAEIDEERVKSRVDDPRIKARPTFHYRLPDCHIEQKSWSLQTAWESWLVVEKLAGCPQGLEQLADEFLNRDRPLLQISHNDWVEYMDQWLQDHALV